MAISSTVVTIGTTATNVAPDEGPYGNGVSLLVIPRDGDVAVVGASSDTFDGAARGTVGPTGDRSELPVLVGRGEQLWLVAGADVEVAVFVAGDDS